MIILLLIQLASHHQTVIEADPRCVSSPNVVYHVGELVCVPSEVIFRSNFDG